MLTAAKRYTGLVGFVTSLVFALLYVFFASLFPDYFRVGTLLNDILSNLMNALLANVDWLGRIGNTLNTALPGVFSSFGGSVLVGTTILAVFGRIFGSASCDKISIPAAVRWLPAAGLAAGVFMTVITMRLFYDVSCYIYLPRIGACLSYESAVFGVFSGAMFLLLGGLDVPRKTEVVSTFNEGRRYLTIIMLLALPFWFVFTLLFMLWPRMVFETTQQVRGLFQDAFFPIVLLSLFLGFLTTLILFHQLLRYGVFLWYLNYIYRLRGKFKAYLDYLVQVGVLSKLGGGYSFSNQTLFDRFNREELDGV